MDKTIQANYELAKQLYAAHGIDVDQVLEATGKNQNFHALLAGR